MGEILIISYAFDEPNTVGSFRCTYWADKLVKTGFVVKVITASDAGENSMPGLEVIKVPHSREKSLPLINDPGYAWMKEVMAELDAWDTKRFASIIISGGPFLQMLWGNRLKAKFKSRLFLDFRDPFAINPRFNDGFIKRLIKSLLEKRMCAGADHVITVNAFTAELLHCPIKKVSIIENGFDEVKIGSIVKPDIIKGRIIHAGKVGLDRDPFPLINSVLNQHNVSFEHYGNTIELEQASEKIILHDFIPYNQVLYAIARAEFGLVLTGGDPFVSTTKIFDYIGLEKKILIITNGDVKSGNLGEISKRNPNIYWSKNNETEITRTIEMACERPYISIPTEEFSRGYQFLKLKKLLGS